MIKLFHLHKWREWVVEDFERLIGLRPVFGCDKYVLRRHKVRYCTTCGAVQIKAIPGTDRPAQ